MITGLASMIVGLTIVIWSLWFLPTKHGGTVFLGLFILNFLVGDGIGQIFFFIPAWAFDTHMNKPLTWWRKVLPRCRWILYRRSKHIPEAGLGATGCRGCGRIFYRNLHLPLGRWLTTTGQLRFLPSVPLYGLNFLRSQLNFKPGA